MADYTAKVAKHAATAIGLDSITFANDAGQPSRFAIINRSTNVELYYTKDGSVPDVQADDVLVCPPASERLVTAYDLSGQPFKVLFMVIATSPCPYSIERRD